MLKKVRVNTLETRDVSQNTAARTTTVLESTSGFAYCDPPEKDGSLPSKV